MKKKIWIPAVVVIIFIAAYFLIGNFFYNIALNPKADKDFLNDSENLKPSEMITDEFREKYYALDDAFEEKHQPEEVFIQSEDDLKLQALTYKQPEKTNKWVINVHFYLGDNTRMLRWTRNFYDHGYNVLAPNLRGHGSSEGNYIGMGWHDRKDVIQWIDVILKEDPDAEIMLFGVSMGASTIMMASGEGLPDNVKVIVEDCGYANVNDVFVYQLKELFNLPPFPVINAANTITEMRAGYSFKEADAIKQLKKNTTPILFIQGDADTFVPFSTLDKLYEATDAPKDKFVVAHAGHSEAESMNPDKYWAKVWSFTDPYMNMKQ